MHSPPKKAGTRNPQPRALAPSQLLNCRLSPVGRDGQDHDPVKPRLNPLLQPNPPLPRASSDRNSPLLRPGTLVTTPSAASRASTLVSSPLDNVPERLWNRVLRTSSATTTLPYLSIDDITSTRLSLDEHAILYSSPNSTSRHGTSRRANSVQKAFGDGFKSLRKKIKRFPGSMFFNASRGPPDSLPTNSVQQGSVSTDPHSSPAGIDGALTPGHAKEENLELGPDSENGPSEPEVNEVESPKISSTIREDFRALRHTASGLPATPSALLSPPLPCPSAKPLSFLDPRPSTATQTCPMAARPLLHRSKSLTASTRQTPKRYSSVASVDDFRGHASFNQNRRFSSSGPYIQYDPMGGFGQHARPASRPGTAFMPSRTFPHHVQDPRREVLFMDCPDHNPDFIWKNPRLCRRPSFSSAVHSSPRRLSGRGRGDSYALKPITRSPKIHLGKGDIPGYQKVPVYGPDSIERKQDNEPTSTARSIPMAVGDLLTASTPQPNPRSYDAVISDHSRASIEGQVSIRSWWEKEELLQGSAEQEYGTFDGGRVSRPFSTTFWPGGMGGLRRKPSK